MFLNQSLVNETIESMVLLRKLSHFRVKKKKMKKSIANFDSTELELSIVIKNGSK